MASRLVIEGTSWNDLNLQAAAWFQPGKKLDLQIGLPRDLSVEELATVQQKLLDEGLKLLGPLEMGSNGKWDNALRIRFQQQVPSHGFALIPLVVMIILAVGTVGVAAILGWRIGELIENWAPVLIAGAVIGVLGWAYISKGAR